MTADRQRINIRAAASALAPLAHKHELVLSHGNGPQVGLLALQAAAYTGVEPYPLDVLDAQTEGMIGYMIEQELRNLLPRNVPFATILTMVEVDPADLAFTHPTKFVVPSTAGRMQTGLVWKKAGFFSGTGNSSGGLCLPPGPSGIFEIRPICWLLEQGAIVICTGGGGIPVMYQPENGSRLKGLKQS